MVFGWWTQCTSTGSLTARHLNGRHSFGPRRSPLLGYTPPHPTLTPPVNPPVRVLLLISRCLSLVIRTILVITPTPTRHPSLTTTLSSRCPSTMFQNSFTPPVILLAFLRDTLLQRSPAPVRTDTGRKAVSRLRRGVTRSTRRSRDSCKLGRTRSGSRGHSLGEDGVYHEGSPEGGSRATPVPVGGHEGRVFPLTFSFFPRVH